MPVRNLNDLDLLAQAYTRSRIFLTAVELGIFAALGQRGYSLDGFAKRLGTPVRSTRILADALVALGILEKDGGRYRNSPIARRYLDPRSPLYCGKRYEHALRHWSRWDQLTAVVRRGKPAPRKRDPESARNLAWAMHHTTLDAADRWVGLLSLRGVQEVLDLGGGPGTYSMAFARRKSALTVTLMDVSPSLDVARRLVRQAGLTRRIRFRSRDFLKQGIGGPYDLVFISNVVHIYSEADNHILLQKAVRGLRPGGRVVIKDYFVNRARTRPIRSSVFSVHMLVNTQDGRVYSADAVARWLREAGCRKVRRMSLPRSQQGLRDQGVKLLEGML